MCDEREPLLAYLYEEAEPTERQRVEAHLASCETCREELAGLRNVRADLLAWDVPDHGSVWRPFAPRPAWSWRDVPAWMMATAACVMLALGATGGLPAHALAGQTPSVTAALAPTGPMRAATIVTPSDLRNLE